MKWLHPSAVVFQQETHIAEMHRHSTARHDVKGALSFNKLEAGFFELDEIDHLILVEK